MEKLKLSKVRFIETLSNYNVKLLFQIYALTTCGTILFPFPWQQNLEEKERRAKELEKLEKDLGKGKEVPLFGGSKMVSGQKIEIGLGMGMEDTDDSMEDNDSDS